MTRGTECFRDASPKEAEQMESAFRQTHCDCVPFPVFAQSLDTNFERDENT